MSFGNVIVIALGFRSPMPWADPAPPTTASIASARASRAPRVENSRDMSPPCVIGMPKALRWRASRPALFIVLRIDVVFGADELDELVVRHQTLRELHRPRMGVRLGIIDGDLDVERAVVDAVDALGRFSRVRQRAAVDVQPAAVAESTRFDHERVADPLARRVAEPPRLGLTGWQRPAVGEDLPHASVAFIQDHDHVARLNDLARLGMQMQLHVAERETMRVGIVFRAVGGPLVPELACPWLVRQTSLHHRAEVEERCDAWNGWTPVLGGPRARRAARAADAAAGRCALAPPGVFPDARQIRMAVEELRRRRGDVHFAVGHSGHAGLG